MPRREALAIALLVATHAAISWAGFDRTRPTPFSGRFAWSMFAGPLTGRCEHTLVRVDPTGRSHAPPLPPPGTALHRVLSAESPAAFAAIAPTLHAYADHDAVLARSLDDLLARWWRTHPASRSDTLVSTLRCTTPLARPFARSLRLGPFP